MKNTQEGLKRDVQPRHIQLIALGGIIGSGYFLGTGYIIQKAGSGAFLAYILGGIIVLAVMFSLGELAVEIPISSSFVTYANEFISPTFGCGVGWSYWITWVTYVPSEMIAAGMIMNQFFPFWDSFYWTLLFGVLVTIVNISHVKHFGEFEFWFSLIKIFAILLFVGVSGYILFFYDTPLKPNFVWDVNKLFPKGFSSILLTMVIILVNFQGSEIIGLTAGESENPEKSIPIAIRNVTWRIISLYAIPVFLLVCILPTEATEENLNLFANSLSHYGFSWAGGLFSFAILTAAISCSSSGLYGCSRAMFALSRERMAPRILCDLNKKKVPQNSVLFSLGGVWLGILFYYWKGEAIYTNLLALSGFSGAISWISISLAHYNFRKKIRKEGREESLKFKAPFYPFLPLFSIISQLLCLGLMFFNPDLRPAFYLGVPALLLPILIYSWMNRKNLK